MGNIINRSYNFDNVPKIVYSAKDIRKILSISEQAVSRLLAKKPFPIIIAVRTKLVPIKLFNRWLKDNFPEIQRENIKFSPMQVQSKKSYSVPEIRRMLGIGKTSSYEFIKSQEIETIIIGGNIRVTKESFDKWFYSGDSLNENNEEEL